MDKNIWINVLGLISVIVLLDIIAWWFLKKYHLTKRSFFLYIAIIIYALLPLMIIKILKYEGIGTTNMIWNIFSTTIVLLMGYFLFNETLTHYQFLGVMFGILAIVLLCLGHK